MPELRLKPIKESTEEWEEAERRIRELLRREIFLPALKALGYAPATLQNAKEGDALKDALYTGRVTFSRGIFSGHFSASITKALKALGAKYDRRLGAFRLPLAELPAEIKSLIAASETRFAERLKAIDRRLAAIAPEALAEKLSLSDTFDQALFKTDTAFRESVKKVSVAPELTPARRKKIADEWQNNMRLDIKTFAEDEIKKLRREMKKTVFAGNRYGAAVGAIEAAYGVSKNKAKFLARQETNLLLTTFKEARYQESGIHEYIWKTVAGSPAHPVRPWHKDLDGKKFRFDKPPISTDVKGKYGKPQPERRNNPGRDFNCRCVSIPVVRF